MVVLVNQNSASAAEIVSACLQDHKRAKVVGQRSYGKGSVQNILELEDGNSVLKLTVATYQRPSGKNIHRFKDAKDTDEWGVSPDPGLEVKLTPERVRRPGSSAAATATSVSQPRRTGPTPSRRTSRQGRRARPSDAKPRTRPAEQGRSSIASSTRRSS